MSPLPPLILVTATDGASSSQQVEEHTTSPNAASTKTDKNDPTQKSGDDKQCTSYKTANHHRRERRVEVAIRVPVMMQLKTMSLREKVMRFRRGNLKPMYPSGVRKEIDSVDEGQLYGKG